jgi:hypothetical protein
MRRLENRRDGLLVRREIFSNEVVTGELSTGRSLSSGRPKAGPDGPTRLDETGIVAQPQGNLMVRSAAMPRVSNHEARDLRRRRDRFQETVDLGLQAGGRIRQLFCR